MQEKKFTSHKQYLVLFYRNAKDTYIDQSVLSAFLLSPN